MQPCAVNCKVDFVSRWRLDDDSCVPVYFEDILFYLGEWIVVCLEQKAVEAPSI